MKKVSLIALTVVSVMTVGCTSPYSHAVVGADGYVDFDKTFAQYPNRSARRAPPPPPMYTPAPTYTPPPSYNTTCFTYPGTGETRCTTH